VVIDAHHHLWNLAAREHRWLMGAQPWASDDEMVSLRRSFTLADLTPLAAAAGITGTVVIQTVAEPWETPDLLALAVGRGPYQAEDKPCGPAEAVGTQPAPADRLLAGVVVRLKEAVPPLLCGGAAGLAPGRVVDLDAQGARVHRQIVDEVRRAVADRGHGHRDGLA
jgi:hypothetical protein